MPTHDTANERALTENRSSARVPNGMEQRSEVVSILSAVVRPETPIDRCPTNLDLTNPSHAALAVAAVGMADVQLDQTGKATIRATHYLIYGDYMRSEATGEMEPVVPDDWRNHSETFER